ncbi:MAG: YdiU family protein [Paracoccaceae bacterium]|nr:YdiU family protein [Paracoccaceae bacterium]
MGNQSGIKFENSYALLPKEFYARVNPESMPKVNIVNLNTELAEELRLNPTWLIQDEGIKFLSGQEIVTGSEPLAQAYAGHQFGTFVPQLGDGRALLLGEIKDINGNKRDVQLKGSGRTPFSRNGDGRATLGPVLREYLISEYMNAINIPTTRSLAAISTGETVIRERQLPGALLVRVASSHVRIGTFQYFHARQMTSELKILADYIIGRHYPSNLWKGNVYLELFRNIVKKQADLISHWMSIGFIHGVMNTDNTNVSGETIDYGPCAFMDRFQFDKVYSSIDHTRRYCYQNQPKIILWNLTRLAETMLTLIDTNVDTAIEKAEEILNEFPKLYEDFWVRKMSSKLALCKTETVDKGLVENFLNLLHDENLDFHNSFYFLGDLLEAVQLKESMTSDHQKTIKTIESSNWYISWRKRLMSEKVDQTELTKRLRLQNPSAFPRNHLVEQALNSAIYDENMNPFKDLLAGLMNPFKERSLQDPFAHSPKSSEEITQTFCGT